MRRAAPWLVAGLGLLLAVAGAVVFRAANLAASGGGWAPYAPLEPGAPAPYTGTPPSGWGVLLGAPHAAGAGLVVLGLLVLVGLTGWLLGRRSERSRRGR